MDFPLLKHKLGFCPAFNYAINRVWFGCFAHGHCHCVASLFVLETNMYLFFRTPEIIRDLFVKYHVVIWFIWYMSWIVSYISIPEKLCLADKNNNHNRNGEKSRIKANRDVIKRKRVLFFFQDSRSSTDSTDKQTKMSKRQKKRTHQGMPISNYSCFEWDLE